MFIVSKLICLTGKHDPKRSEVKYDGGQYVGHCRHCGAEIERLAHRKWREKSA